MRSEECFINRRNKRINNWYKFDVKQPTECCKCTSEISRGRFYDCTVWRNCSGPDCVSEDAKSRPILDAAYNIEKFQLCIKLKVISPQLDDRGLTQ
jgi:hypothetical protein